MKIILGGHWNNDVLADGWTVCSETDVNLTKPLPFTDNSASCIFTEHVIEHLHREQATAFFREAYRVLKPSGILRTVFPSVDVRKYQSPEKIFDATYNHKHKHIWAVFEMIFELEKAGFPKAYECSHAHGAVHEYCQERHMRAIYFGSSRVEDRAFNMLHDSDSSFVEAQKLWEQPILHGVEALRKQMKEMYNK